MTPLTMAGAARLPENINSANDSVLSANSEQYARDQSPEPFSGLVQNYMDDGQDATGQTERLEMIQGAVEDMDDSEVVGFLAMLESQSGWDCP